MMVGLLSAEVLMDGNGKTYVRYGSNWQRKSPLNLVGLAAAGG